MKIPKLLQSELNILKLNHQFSLSVNLIDLENITSKEMYDIHKDCDNIIVSIDLDSATYDIHSWNISYHNSSTYNKRDSFGNTIDNKMIHWIKLEINKKAMIAAEKRLKELEKKEKRKQLYKIILNY